MAHLTLIQAITDGLRCALRQDERVVVFGEDVGENGGVFRATDGLFQEFGGGRVMDTPLSEGGILGTAIGMAAYGMRPVPEIQFDGFLPMAFDQLLSHAARIRWRTRGRFSCPITVRVPYGAGIHAPEHHSDSPEAYYVHTPGFKVVVPSNPFDAKGLLLSAIEDPGPVLFFEPKRIYRAVRQEVPSRPYAVPLGQATLVAEGNDVTVIAYGSMMGLARRAVDGCRPLGISADLIDVRTVWPLDIETITRSVSKTGRCVVVQEAPRSAGFAAEIVALLHAKAFDALHAPVVRVTGFDTAVPYYRMENYYLPTEARIMAGIRRAVEY